MRRQGLFVSSRLVICNGFEGWCAGVCQDVFGLGIGILELFGDHFRVISMVLDDDDDDDDIHGLGNSMEMQSTNRI